MNWDDIQDEKRTFFKERIEVWDIINSFFKISEFTIPNKYNCNYLEWKIDSNILVLYLDEQNKPHVYKNGTEILTTDIAHAVQEIKTLYRNYSFLKTLTK